MERTLAPMVEGLLFPGYTAEDAAPDLGDSAITETLGVGGFAMGTAPSIVQFVGGTPIAEMIAAGWNVVISHGNGPQVGFILRRSEIALQEVIPVPITPRPIPRAPSATCSKGRSTTNSGGWGSGGRRLR